VGSADGLINNKNKKRKIIPTTAKLEMTFLDPHSSGFHSAKKCCGGEESDIENESPSTVCLARIEGLMKSPLTTAVNHCGQLQESLRGPYGLI